MRKSKFARLSFVDKALLLGGYILLGIFVLLIVVPLCYVVIASFMDPTTLNSQGISLDPSKWTLMKQYKSPSRAGETNKCWRR